MVNRTWKNKLTRMENQHHWEDETSDQLQNAGTQAQIVNAAAPSVSGMYAGQNMGGNNTYNTPASQNQVQAYVAQLIDERQKHEAKQKATVQKVPGYEPQTIDEVQQHNAKLLRPAYLDQSTGKGVAAPYVEPVKARVLQMVDEMLHHGAVKRPVVTRVNGRMPQMIDEVQYHGAKKKFVPMKSRVSKDQQFYPEKSYMGKHPYQVDEEQRFGPIDNVEADPETVSYEDTARSVQEEMDEEKRVRDVNEAYLEYLREQSRASWDLLYGSNKINDTEERALKNAYLYYLQNMIEWAESRVSPPETEKGEQWDAWMNRLVTEAGEGASLNRLVELEDMIEYEKQMDTLNETYLDYYREPTEMELQIDQLEDEINDINIELVAMIGFEASAEDMREMEKEREALELALKDLKRKHKQEEKEADELTRWKEREYEELKQRLIEQYGEEMVKNWTHFWRRKQNAEQTKSAMGAYERASYEDPYAMLLPYALFDAFSGNGFFDLLAQNIRKQKTDRPVDPYSGTHAVYWNQKAMEEGAYKRFDDELERELGFQTLPGNAHYIPYEVSKNLANGLMKMLLGPAGPIFAITGAMTDKSLSAIENGASIEDALRAGVATGGIEAGMELLGNAEWLNDLVGPKMKSTIISGAGDLLTAGFDGVHLDDKSEFYAKVKEYEDKGYGAIQAKAKALGDSLRENALEFISDKTLDLLLGDKK